MIVGLVTVAVTRSREAVQLALAGMLVQMIGAGIAGATLVERPGAAIRFALLEPARTALHVACVAGAWSSRRVAWRGHTFRLGRGSVLIADEAPPPSRLRRWLGRGARASAT
jgi:hypothetical protein